MATYRVSDGVMSYECEANTAEQARDDCFGPGYDWGECPADLTEAECVTASSRYTVYRIADDGSETVELTGPLSEVRRLTD